MADAAQDQRPRGATNEDIEATREYVDLLGLKFRHIVEAAADAYRLATVRVIENHDEILTAQRLAQRRSSAASRTSWKALQPTSTASPAI